MYTRGNSTARQETRRPGKQVVGTFGVLLGLSLSVHGADDSFVYAFNAADQLTSVTMNGQTVATMSYDGDGLRVKKAEGGGEVVYIRDEAGNVLAEYDQDGVLLAEYIYANGHQVAKVERLAGVDTFRFFHPDHLGTALVITDEVGDQDWRGEYFPFGEEYSSQGTPNRYRFVERETDQATGLSYMHARYYNARLGRFMSIDPVGGRVEDSQSWNRYSYVQNSPVRFVDPTGMIADEAASELFSNITTEAQFDRVASAHADGLAVLNLGMDLVNPGKVGSATAFAVAAGEGTGAVAAAVALDTARAASAVALVRAGVSLVRGAVSAFRQEAISLNKLNHVFGQPRHNLGGLAKSFGSEEAAFRAIQEATEEAVRSQGIRGVFQTTVEVSGQSLTVRGNVIDGAVKIGTAFQ